MTPKPPPPMGDVQASRGCSRLVGFLDAAVEILCGATPVMHIAWDRDGESLETGFVCAEHRDEAIERWSWLDQHDLGPNCGMPGAWWSFDEHTCILDELPTSDPTRSLAKAVPA